VGERRLEIRVACNTPSLPILAFTNHPIIILDLAGINVVDRFAAVFLADHFVEASYWTVISAGELNCALSRPGIGREAKGRKSP